MTRLFGYDSMEHQVLTSYTREGKKLVINREEREYRARNKDTGDLKDPIVPNDTHIDRRRSFGDPCCIVLPVRLCVFSSMSIYMPSQI